MKCISLIGGERCQADRAWVVAFGYIAVHDPADGLFCGDHAKQTAADLNDSAEASAREPKPIRPADRRLA